MHFSTVVRQRLTAIVLVFFACLPILSVSQNTNGPPSVTLDYGTFVGASNGSYNITYFRKIPFGASTAGRNRFRAPQPPVPLPSDVPYNTDQDMDMCPQRTVNGTEDCLQLGVYSRPWSRPQPLRPVLLSFYGGGFIRGSAAFKVPPYGFPILNASTQNNYVVVYSNYRTNVFGFLPGSKIQKHPDTDLNPGLLDQQAALKWIQKYIHHFGGDKRNVTIQGQSAGGGSVLAQSIATGNRGKKLFTKATSTSPYWPKTYKWNSKESESIYEQTVKDVGCKGQKDEIECLKNVDVQKLRDSALALSTSQQLTTQRFTFAPVIDDKFLTEPLSKVIRRGELNADFVQTSYNQHEGEDFTPQGFLNETTGIDGFNSSLASFNKYLEGFLPDFSRKQLEELKRLYPEQGATETLTWNTTYVRAGVLYRDLVLSCPAYWFSGKAKQGYLIEYTIAPAKHATDVAYWNDINPIQKADPLNYQAYTGAIASFVQTGNPNAHKLTSARVPGVPQISKSKEFVITKDGPQVGGIEWLERRCDFWLRNSDRVPI